MMLKYKRLFNSENALLIVSVLIILFSMSLKIFLLFNQPLNLNEGGYGVVAKGIIEGKKPYIDFFDHKPPMLYYFLLFSFKVIGISSFSIHLLAAIFDLALLISIFLVTKRLYNIKLAIFASAVYCVFVFDMALDTEIPMNLFGLIGIFLYIISFEKKNKFWPLLFSGFFIALSVWFKQPGILFFIAILIHQAFLVYRKEIKLKKSLKYLYIIIAGALVLSIPLLSYFIYLVGFSKFFYSLVLFNFKFAGSTSRLLQIGKFFRLLFSYFGIFLAIIFCYRKEIFREEYPQKNVFFGVLASVLIIFFILYQEISYGQLYQLIPSVLLLSLFPLFLKIDKKVNRLLIFVLIVFILSLFLQNLETFARMYRDGYFYEQNEVVFFVKENIPEDSRVFSDSPQYNLLSGIPVINRAFLLAPSFNSILDYSFLCSNNKSDVDFILFSHRKKFLNPEILSCVESNFQLVKKFEGVGESYIEVWQNRK